MSLTYTEHRSKNRWVSLQEFRLENKTVTCHAIPDSRPKCLVYLMSIYLKKLPPYAFEKDVLYMRPKVKF